MQWCRDGRSWAGLRVHWLGIISSNFFAHWFWQAQGQTMQPGRPNDFKGIEVSNKYLEVTSTSYWFTKQAEWGCCQTYKTINPESHFIFLIYLSIYFKCPLLWLLWDVVFICCCWYRGKQTLWFLYFAWCFDDSSVQLLPAALVADENATFSFDLRKELHIIHPWRSYWCPGPVVTRLDFHAVIVESLHRGWWRCVWAFCSE